MIYKVKLLSFLNVRMKSIKAILEHSFDIKFNSNLKINQKYFARWLIKTFLSSANKP